jgi:hypothetical protein
MHKFCEKKVPKSEENKYNLTFIRVSLKIAQNEVNWFKFIEIYIFEGRNVELFQKKNHSKTR